MHRGDQFSDSIKYWIRPDLENRIKEGSVQAHLRTHVTAISATKVALAGPGGAFELPADDVLLLTGYRPDVALLSRAGVRIDPTSLKPEHDPETFETNVPGVFAVGDVRAGSVKRVAAAVGEGSTAVRSVHEHLATTAG